MTCCTDRSICSAAFDWFQEFVVVVVVFVSVGVRLNDGVLLMCLFVMGEGEGGSLSCPNHKTMCRNMEGGVCVFVCL